MFCFLGFLFHVQLLSVSSQPHHLDSPHPSSLII
jgi:hypothetical protein